jgi:hypothetical protein
MSEISAPGAFYEELANTAGWRSRCHHCGCPKWAHASRDFTFQEMIVVGACACGCCNAYERRRFKSRDRSEVHAPAA